MKPSEFENRIASRAEKRFDEEFGNLVSYINNHPIGKRLKIKVADKEIALANFGGNFGLLNDSGVDNKNSTLTNLDSIMRDLLADYRQKEVDDILSKLESFHYLFEQN